MRSTRADLSISRLRIKIWVSHVDDDEPVTGGFNKLGQCVRLHDPRLASHDDGSSYTGGCPKSTRCRQIRRTRSGQEEQPRCPPRTHAPPSEIWLKGREDSELLTQVVTHTESAAPLLRSSLLSKRPVWPPSGIHGFWTTRRAVRASGFERECVGLYVRFAQIVQAGANS